MNRFRTVSALALLLILLAACAPLQPAPAAPLSTPEAAPEGSAPATGESAPTAAPATEREANTSPATPACCAAQPLTTPVTTTITGTISPDRSIVGPVGGEHTNGAAAPGTDAHDASDHGATGHANHSGHTMADPSVPFDAAFLDDMILHHEGAIAMARDLLQNSERPELVEMANTILAAQSAEIEEMQGQRTAWYPDLPAGQATGMTMGDMEVSADSSIPYEQRFLTAMIAHHAGAIGMAQMALEQAEHPEVRELAAAIIAAQEAEIAQMQTWLLDWFGE